jgi:hypothetical protein
MESAIVTFAKAVLAGIGAIFFFLIAVAGMQTQNNIVMVFFFVLMVIAALFAKYEWDKKD